MKIAITTNGNDLSAALDRRFGRAEKFLITDADGKDLQVVDNTQNLNAAQGAGIQAAQNVAATGVKAVISGHCGPKAFQVLQQSGVAIYPCEAATVGEALEQYRSGKLKAAAGADVSGHWM